jgi:hypothetical protein
MIAIRKKRKMMMTKTTRDEYDGYSEWSDAA